MLMVASTPAQAQIYTEYVGAPVIADEIIAAPPTVVAPASVRVWPRRIVVKQPRRVVVRSPIVVAAPVVTETRLIQPAPVIERRIIQPAPIVQERVIRPSEVVQTRYIVPYGW